MKDPVPLNPRQKLMLSIFFILDFLIGVWWYLIMALISLMATYAEELTGHLYILSSEVQDILPIF